MRDELRQLTTPTTDGVSTDPLASAAQFMRSLFSLRKPKPAGKQYQITDHRGHSRVKYLTDEEVEVARKEGLTLVLVKDLPGQPKLVDDHEQRITKSFGQGTVSHKLTHRKFGKKWSGKHRHGKSSYHSYITYRKYSEDGKTYTQYRLPRKEDANG